MSGIFKFGPHTIPAGQIFLKTTHCFGLVNLKPILPRLGDFLNNDDIYDEITRNTSNLLDETEDGTLIAPPKGVDNEERRARSEEDMAKEAARLTLLLQQS
ncbi:hypothetical protein BG011_002977 [Mortierella polycephala]|uniref:Uncharacterized protein n=1 Tax=Mortierella polycephala TaxID=41804 RepID=A0A9P6U4M2_9FUNG|nr:hypothetical protein BG011_002977 [Mortierella polycephala]